MINEISPSHLLLLSHPPGTRIRTERYTQVNMQNTNRQAEITNKNV